MNSLRRLARYLKGTEGYGVWLPAGGDTDVFASGVGHRLGELQENSQELRRRSVYVGRLPHWVLQPGALDDLFEQRGSRVQWRRYCHF